MDFNTPDFLLPRLKLDPTYTETSATDVKWLDALCETVTFVSWDEFDGLINRTRKKVEKADERFINSAKLILCANTGTSSREHLEVNETNDSEGSTTQVTTPTNEEKFLTLGYLVELFTDSTSTDGLHDNLFRAASLLLRGLHTQKDLRFVNRGYSSQIGMEFDAVGKHLPHHVTIRPDRILARRPAATLERLPICTFEWKGPGLDFTCMGGSSGSANSARMEVLLQECVRYQVGEHPEGEEILFGIVSSIEKPNTGSSEKEDIPHPVNAAPDPLSSESSKTSRTLTAPSPNPTIPFRVKNIDEIVEQLIQTGSRFKSGISASTMSTFLEFLFQQRSIPSESNQSMKFARLTRIAVAQAISQGLLSESGCFYLSTYLMGLAFEIRGIDKRGKVVVAVSRPFHCHLKPGLVYSILALAERGLENLKDGGIETASRVRKCADVVSTTSFNMRSKKIAGSNSASMPSTAANDSTGGSSSKRQKKDNSSQRASAASFEDDSEGCKSLEAKFCTPLPHTRNAIEVENLGSPVTFFDDSNLEPRSEVVDINERIKSMFQTCTQVLAIGGSGVVMEGRWDGFRAAIKCWNGGKLEGEQILASEVDTYLYIEQSIPSILGVAIPRLLLGLNINNCLEESAYSGEAILITELVGHKVWRNNNGTLTMEETNKHYELTRKDEALLCKAARKSLHLLHYHGILHGDVELRNLRVQRSLSSTGGNEWRAWWIDLGNAQFVEERSFALRCENEQYESLFSFHTEES